MTYQTTSPNPAEQLRHAMRHWASGIGIATTLHDGQPHGLTVSSFTSISVEPPVIMISVHKEAEPHDHILRSGVFAVTLLSANQQELSDRFAGRTDDQDRFSGLDTFTLETGSPLLPGGLAVFDCRISGIFDTATTTVFFGEVLSCQVSTEVGLKPLLYHDQGYRSLWE
jgi:cob(II)yrinic acid a,c-diamide reductase